MHKVRRTDVCAVGSVSHVTASALCTELEGCQSMGGGCSCARSNRRLQCVWQCVCTPYPRHACFHILCWGWRCCSCVWSHRRLSTGRISASTIACAHRFRMLSSFFQVFVGVCLGACAHFNNSNMLELTFCNWLVCESWLPSETTK